MPNWSTVLEEIAKVRPSKPGESSFDIVRRKYLAQLEAHTGRNVIGYYSAFLTKPGAPGVELGDEDKNGLMLCVHKLDRTRGLDLILHTGGGDVGAVESIVFYLREMFGTDVRAIVPQLALSAGAMIACSCSQIVMGKHSAIGPVDPQIDGVPVVGVIQEFERARTEIAANESASLIWDPILAKLKPSFLSQCVWAKERSEDFLRQTLAECMLRDELEPARSQKIDFIVARLTASASNAAHNRHIHHRECEEMGLKIKLLEDRSDRVLQDLVLTVHHTYMHTLANTPAIKIIENHLGRAQVRMMTQAAPSSVQLPQPLIDAFVAEFAKSNTEGLVNIGPAAQLKVPKRT
jgi:hypothetical protein